MLITTHTNISILRSSSIMLCDAVPVSVSCRSAGI